MGKNRIAKSVRTLGMLLPRKNFSFSMHVPCIVVSHAKVTGEHWKITAKVMEWNHMATMIPRMATPHRTNSVGKTRWYMLKTLILTAVIRDTYKSWPAYSNWKKGT